MLTTHRPDAFCLLETKSSAPSNPPRFIQRLGFTEHLAIPSDGYAGGIWLFWNPFLISINVLFSSTQLIHCFLSQGSKSMYATLAYIRPTSAMKQAFWNQARDIAATIQGPWVLMGDLNDIALDSERAPPRNGTGTGMRSQQFRDNIQSCNLLDMEASGAKFTWIRTENGIVTL